MVHKFITKEKKRVYVQQADRKSIQIKVIQPPSISPPRNQSLKRKEKEINVMDFEAT